MLCIKRRSPDSFKGYTWGTVENTLAYTYKNKLPSLPNSLKLACNNRCFGK